jgi:hypothetical protein
MVKEVSQRSALSGRLSVLDSAPISRSRDIALVPGSRLGAKSIWRRFSRATFQTPRRRPQWRPRWGRFLWPSGRSYFGGTNSLSIQPRAFDFKGSVCTCASYTRPQLVHLSVRYSNPARIWTTLWTVGGAWHFGQRERPSGAVTTGSDGGASMSPIGLTPRARTTRSGQFGSMGGKRGQLNSLARNDLP